MLLSRISFFRTFGKKGLKTLDIAQYLCHNDDVIDVQGYVTSG
jgi:hypothetical protein